MAVNKQLRKPEQSALDLAVAAVVEGDINPLDDEGMSAVNPDPTSLDLPQEEDRCPTGELCSNYRRSHTVEDQCILCGKPVCDDRA